MPKLNSTTTTLCVSIVLAAAIVFAIQNFQSGRNLGSAAVSATAARAQTTGQTTDTAPAASRWAATAPGTVQPPGGIIEMRPETSGMVVAVHVDDGDVVKAGDPLVKLKDDELKARRNAALTEIRIRELERREDEPSKEASDRIIAEDDVFDAERAVYDAQMAFDKAFIARQNGNGNDADVEAARTALETALNDLQAKRDKLADLLAEADTPLPTRLQGGLETARAELRVIEIAIERTNIRAPSDGTVLDVDARIGELAGPSARFPLVRFGNIQNLTVRAEVSERDLGNIAVGQQVLVEAAAFADQQFEGVVREIAPTLSAPRINGRGPRLQTDVDVIEVTVDFVEQTPLLPGMRVDVYFKPTETAGARTN